MENTLSINIKLNKNFIRQEKSIKDKQLITICYLFFHTTCEHNIYTTINTMCNEMNLPTASRNLKNNQFAIKEVLQTLVQDKIITILNCNNILEVSNNELIKIYFNDYDQYINIASQYVMLSLKEYNTILKCGDKAHKLLNLYCKIKSYICMDDKCLHICYPSIKKICTDFKCSNKTFGMLLKILYENNLIYVYHFEKNDTIKTYYGQIEYVFALEKYTKSEIKKEFMV